MIKDGRPYTNENGWRDNGLITNKEETVKIEVFEWIDENILPRKTANRKHSSYRLKHLLEKDTKIYLTNNEFKDAMLIMDYEPTDANKLNWHYRISEKSPVFARNAK